MDDDDFMAEGDVNSLDNVFKRASDYVAANSSSFNQDDLLYLYGRYKIATCGRCNEPQPGLLKFRNRSKWTAWNTLGDMPKDQAMEDYTEKVGDVNPDWDNVPTKRKNYGPVTSTCLKLDPEILESSKTVFDFVKEGNLPQVQKLLQLNSSLKDSKDEEGLSLLHWACDRGNCHVADCLISAGADVNSTDKDGQTALHYASSCGHEEVIRLLLSRRASVNVFDADGLTPLDVAYSTAVKELLVKQPV